LTYILPILNHEEIENPNRSLTRDEIESVIKAFNQRKVLILSMKIATKNPQQNTSKLNPSAHY
jgi:hypothetical protein